VDLDVQATCRRALVSRVYIQLERLRIDLRSQLDRRRLARAQVTWQRSIALMLLSQRELVQRDFIRQNSIILDKMDANVVLSDFEVRHVGMDWLLVAHDLAIRGQVCSLNDIADGGHASVCYLNGKIQLVVLLLEPQRFQSQLGTQLFVDKLKPWGIFHDNISGSLSALNLPLAVELVLISNLVCN